VNSQTGEQIFWTEQLAQGLSFPTSFAWLPNGDMLIAERGGTLRLFANGALQTKPISGVPPVSTSVFDGLKDVESDPDFATNKTIYLLLTEGTYDKHDVAVYRAVYADDHLTNVTRIFRTRDEPDGVGPTAARMLFLPDKTLLIGVADQGKGQDLTSDLGKVLRLNRDGSVPANNPFVGTPGVLPEIYTYGHRVPHGLFFDKATNTIYEAEPGPRGGDELNILKPKQNYGWPKATWGFSYMGGLQGPEESDPAVQDPIYIWTPSMTPSNLTRYEGDLYPAWKGDFFIGTLSGHALERMRFSDNKFVERERLLLDLDERIRDVKVGPDGKLYVLTDHSNGRLLRLNPGRPSADDAKRQATKLTVVMTDLAGNDFMHPDVAKGKEQFQQMCSGCHTAGPLAPGGDIGPSLETVGGRRAGSLPSFAYSDAMRKNGGTWDYFAISRFLADPQATVPGTAMSAPPIPDQQTRNNIAAFLALKPAKPLPASPNVTKSPGK
jgi:glucose/arabinose dehydrogenase/cytochrome c2